MIRTLPKNKAVSLALSHLLAAATASAATVDWSGATSADWSLGANWLGGQPPADNTSADLARFHFAASPTFAPNTGTRSVRGLIIGDGSTAVPAFTLSGTLLTLGAGGITQQAGSLGATLATPLALAANQSWTNAAAASLAVTGPVSLGTHTLTAAGTGSLSLAGALSGTGALAKSGTGTLTLAGANTYSGGTTVNAGRLAGDTTSLQGDIASLGVVEFAQASAGTYAGVLSGTGQLIKTGAGTLTLSGDNTFTGGLRIEAGTVLAGIGGKKETLGGPGNIVTFAGVGATLRAAGSVKSDIHDFHLEQDGILDTNSFTLTLTGTLSGLGGLIKTGAGLLELDGVGTFTGPLTVNQGTASVTKVGALRAGSDAHLADTAGATFGIKVDQTIGRLTGGGSAGGTAALDGHTLSVGAGNVSSTFGGRFTGSNTGHLHKVGSGSLTLTNTATNDAFTGGVRISGGSLRISAVESLGERGTHRTLHLETGGELSLLEDLSFNTRIFHLGAADTSGAAGVFRVASGKTAYVRGLVKDDVQSGAGALVKDGAGTLVLEGLNTYTGGTIIRGGTLLAGVAGNRSTLGAESGDITFDGAGATLRISANIADSTRSYHYLQTGIIDTAGFNLELNAGSTGSGGLTKVGLGTLSLGGAHGHNGHTNVSAGRLVVNGTLAGAVTVASAATLGGSGVIGGDVTLAGVHNPGNSPGIQTIQGDLTYLPSATILWELAAQSSANSPVAFDQILVGGDLAFGGFTSLSLVFDAAGSAVLWSDNFWSTAQSWLLYDVAGTLTGFENLQISALSADSAGALLGSARPGATFALSQVGTDILLAYTPVPEPSTYGLLLGTLALAASALRRRKKGTS